MMTSKISPKYQIVIPKAVRQRLGLKPGQSLQVTERENHIELRLILSPNRLLGILADCRHIPFEREKDRELP
ncbi:MAG TPA: AbrB/MazE/SpoVT family DNA-binding domain-containing protein [Terrimicrobiaceae bacterium]